MKKVLVTGADGLVGHELSRALIQRGYAVRGAVWKANSRTVGSGEFEGVQFCDVGSIGADTDWSDALNGVDTVVHLAARVHMTDDRAPDPLAAYREVNVAGTRILAEAAVDNGIRRFVFLSSIKVNGERTEDRPFTEKDPPCPIDLYSISKWEAEQVLRTVSDKGDLEVVVLRSPLVYGPGVKANFLRLLQLVDRNVPLPLARIDNRRSMIYLRNLTDAIVVCCINPRASGEMFLVSDGKDVSTPELIKMIASAMRRKPLLFPLPQPLLRIVGALAGKTGELDRLVSSLRVDIGKIGESLNWKPPFALEEGLLETVKWYEACH